MRTIGNGRSSVARALMSTIGATGSVKLVAAAGVGSGVGSGFGLGDGAGVGVGLGVGVGVGPGIVAATTTAVVTDCALIESTLFFSVIRTPSRKPRSAVVTTYVAAVAFRIASHEPPVDGQRRHWYFAVGTGSPVQVATPVSVA